MLVKYEADRFPKTFPDQGRFYVGAGGGGHRPPKCWPGPPNILVPTAKIRILKI